MKNPSKYFFLFILFIIQNGYGQQKQTLPVVGKSIPTVSFFVAADYFAPKFEDVDAVFRTIERNYALPAGSDFKDYYSVLAGIRFAPVPQHSIQLEFGGSLFRSSPSGSLGEGRSASFIHMYYAGGTYLYSFPVGAVDILLGCGLGYVGLNAERTYQGQSGVAQVNAGLTQAHAQVEVEYIDASGFSVALDGGYSFATTLFPQRAEIDFTIKGIYAGVKIGIPLIKTF
ncbi:MAG TPA: hypothetical protein VLX91_12360 [Candidatus Acidoferrales bacterium]|nr:hypothetical protein [Candidatus Acidoferrales bacterium]